MTGPEHYREAETLLSEAHRITDGFPGEQYAQTLAEAQVHATLALAAAVALSGVILTLPQDSALAVRWDDAIGVTP